MTNNFVKTLADNDEDKGDGDAIFHNREDVSALAKDRLPSYMELDYDSDSHLAYCALDYWIPQIESGDVSVDEDEFRLPIARLRNAIVGKKVFIDLWAGTYCKDSSQLDKLIQKNREGDEAAEFFSERFPDLNIEDINKSFSHFNSIADDEEREAVREIVALLIENPEARFSCGDDVPPYWRSIVENPGEHLWDYVHDQCVFMNLFQDIVVHEEEEEISFVTSGAAKEKNKEKFLSVLAGFDRWWT